MSVSVNWKPSATLEALNARAALNRSIREFFIDTNALEVELPILNHAPVADMNIEAIAVPATEIMPKLYLHTSPEYSMKRLLCAGSGDIYALGKVFRAGEAGGRHNPEFTMLEWYRLGMDHQELMHEVADLLEEVFSDSTLELIDAPLYLTYQQAVIQYAGVDPFTASDDDIKQLGIELAAGDLELNRDGWLDMIMSHKVEKALPENQLVFIYNYPASQAALAKLNKDDNGQMIAERFEVYLNSLELANGYHELTDSKEQRQRFEQELRATDRPIDEKLLTAMADTEAGLPDCAGVAMGVDRILMLQLGMKTIAEVISFSADAC
ncbi:MAG: EF-P lysine aminoacylase GenX [Oleispira antarctica]|uniref:Lysyl-tRNA synthetase n=1 Tax=Oleispira antarctica RB-8 TaxID=698738 RepID=R4YMQ3_OLEAN|nr:EF-P lysine aminoacylase GenX [Oleispira antarctica]MBQ0792767.1 EF-P lysine aminoacylase GenX [Oleispira antarctica]CCK74363.1 Lysyl-tRNA synthetase [Oleispira antarctica RB-8]|tara:strand:- start:6037 stop:7008 length:972 start_codon:yes stop_codon:yes gene_type:complete